MDTKEIFQKQGYCLVRDAISQELRDIITQYALFDEMQNFTPEKTSSSEPQVGEAHSKYADPAMESLLLHLHDKMESSTGLVLHPTYSYFRVYRPGDELEKHIDRPSCEISATVCFNFNYNDANFKWPIVIENNPIIQSPGDMAVYRGCELFHWREVFDSTCEEDWHIQGFFHYVDANGPYAEYKYDQRPILGIKRNQAKKQPETKSYIRYV
jgi:hypothetical protein